MAAYLIAHVSIKDHEKWHQYASSTGPTFEPFNAELVFRGKRTEVLVGEHEHTAVAVLKFENAEDIPKWYNSDAYQALIEVRNSGADVTFIAYEELG